MTSKIVAKVLAAMLDQRVKHHGGGQIVYPEEAEAVITAVILAIDDEVKDDST